MKYVSIFALLFISAVLFSCKSEDDQPFNELVFIWDQTKCADPWGNGENKTNEETKTAVISYLEDEGVQVQNLDFDDKSNLDVYCEACSCGTGQRILVEVRSEDIEKMEDLGFYQ
ncbi:hypothetical protein [Algoriphagus sp. PAP.12]|uniref:hypothetical protein n=1 Tax=Algoriphagus sp. PAP.12 TaxID=2996678 RepID=UPI00227B02AC|nr:hypothetical protein [Algoriphagus sp. PAP.12]